MAHVTTTQINKARTYLTFLIGSEEYGLEIQQVLEIIKFMDPAIIPGSSSEMLGVINLRGQVIPVISLRKRFGFEEIERTDNSVIIVVETDKGKLGFAIDQVHEVITYNQSEIEPPPEYGLQIDTDYISAIANVGDHICIILNIAKILSHEAQVDLQKNLDSKPDTEE